MQILKLDLKNDTVKLRIHDLDDLWTIYNTVQPGDMVLAKTFRREKLDTEDSRPERGEKKPIFLGIRIEKVEFHKYVNMVRLMGKIERGVDIGSYHTINVQAGSVFSIVRNWKKIEIDNLKEAVRESKRPMILIVALEEGGASFALIRQRGVDLINEILVNIPGKREKSAREKIKREFYTEISQAILEIASSRGLTDVLIVGPELTRTGFKTFVEQSGDMMSAVNIAYDTCFSPGRTGIYEAIRRGAVDRVVSSSRVSMELSEVEEFLTELSKGGKATYGLNQVEDAVRSGAVEKLLVTDQFFRERREKIDALIRQVEKYQGHHLMISTEHEGGIKLQSLGGLCVILRYQIPESEFTKS